MPSTKYLLFDLSVLLKLNTVIYQLKARGETLPSYLYEFLYSDERALTLDSAQNQFLLHSGTHIS